MIRYLEQRQTTSLSISRLKLFITKINFVRPVRKLKREFSEDLHKRRLNFYFKQSKIRKSGSLELLKKREFSYKFNHNKSINICKKLVKIPKKKQRASRKKLSAISFKKKSKSSFLNIIEKDYSKFVF